MGHNFTPMQVCEALIGKPEEIAIICGYTAKAAFPWRRAAENRDAGDLPSARVMRRLLAHSRANHLGLEARHLIEGAPEAEIAEILAARVPRAQEAA